MAEEPILNKKKWYKKKRYYIILILLLVFGGLVYSKAKNGSNKPKYETVTVQKGKIKQTVDATGSVESAGEVDLRFENSGKINKIYKQANDKVKAGEIIAELELDQFNSRVAQANASLAQAKANLDKVLVGNKPEYIQSMQASVDSAKANLQQTKAVSETAVNSAQAALDTAVSNLKLAGTENDSQIIKDAYDNMYVLLVKVQNTLASSLVTADNILGVDNSFANSDYKDVLSLLDTSKLNIAKTRYLTAKTIKNDFDTLINGMSSKSEQKNIDWAADQAEDALSIYKDLYFSLGEVLDNTRPIGGLTQAELDTLNTNIQTQRTNVNTVYSSLISSQQAVVAAKKSFVDYQIAYQKANKDFEETKKKAAADIAVAEASLSKAEANLAEAKNPPRDVDTAALDAQVKQAQASLMEAVANRKKAIIIAPVEGVIGKIDSKVGELVTQTNIIVKLISPHFEVKVDIPETDISKISVGDNADIKLDAFGDDVVFKGTVTEIEKGETVIQDVVYYSVQLSLSNDEQHDILNGMTANVLFYTEEKDNVLIVPQRAIRTREKEKYVRVLEGENNLVEKTVKTGLKGDEGNIEIIEGVNVGENVVTNTL